jgi:lycopene beta-cyclase
VESDLAFGPALKGAVPDLLIAGGGLAGCLTALALVRDRPDVSLRIIEQDDRFGGNHIWSFFDSDLDAEARALVEPLITRSWPRHDIRFPAQQRTLAIGYNSIRSQQLDEVMRATLRPDQFQLGGRIEAVTPTEIVLDDGERLVGGAVIDARGPAPMLRLELGWQKFVGRTYRFDSPHGCERPIIMDALVDQQEGYRFVYSLPFSDTELMVEDTYYSTSPVLDAAEIGRRVEDYVGGAGELMAEETGVLPVVLSGDIDALWPAKEPAVPKLGLRGGFFHPTTGYSLPDACANALLIARMSLLEPAALHHALGSRARSLWEVRGFFRLLNRMLFHAAEPPRRYRVLEHFYRLPEPVIARFYAARLTKLDKLRILSGRPPVPIGRAIAAMRGTAA